MGHNAHLRKQFIKHENTGTSICFRYFIIISPWKRVWPFILINLNPHHLSMLSAKFGWNWPSSSGEEFFKISSTCFHYFIIISPWKRGWPFILINLNPHQPSLLSVNFGWNWPSGSWEEDENVNSLQTDGRRTTGDQKSSLELSSSELKTLSPQHLWTGANFFYI